MLRGKKGGGGGGYYTLIKKLNFPSDLVGGKQHLVKLLTVKHNYDNI